MWAIITVTLLLLHLSQIPVIFMLDLCINLWTLYFVYVYTHVNGFYLICLWLSTSFLLFYISLTQICCPLNLLVGEIVLRQFPCHALCAFLFSSIYKTPHVFEPWVLLPLLLHGPLLGSHRIQPCLSHASLTGCFLGVGGIGLPALTLPTNLPPVN